MTGRSLVLAVCLLAAAPAAAAPASQNAFAELLDRIARAWAARDTEAALACFAPDAIYMQPPDQQLYRGREELRVLFDGLSAGTFMRFHNVAYDASRQVGLAEFSFGNKGQARADHGVVVATLRDGRVFTWREYWVNGPADFAAFTAVDGKQWRWTAEALKPAVAAIPAGAVAVRSDADVDALLPRVTNWGRWGSSDELGTLNLINPAAVRAARELVREGVTVSLARSVRVAENQGIPQARYEMLAGEWGTRDFVGGVWHGFAQTHLDSLCHVFASPQALYNGVPRSEVGPHGCRRLGIDAVARRGVLGRGVLIDVAGLKGAPLDPGTPILVRDLEAALARQGTSLRPGDLVAVRTGAGPRNTRERRAGLHPECLPWIKEKQVAVLLGDGDSDVAPLAGFERWASAFHSVGIPYMGLSLVDNAELDELARVSAQQRRYEFLLVIAPWRVEGATSSPVNPIAVF
jgi:kynurenine formamidase/ketosteroid isomerase-like protein